MGTKDKASNKLQDMKGKDAASEVKDAVTGT